MSAYSETTAPTFRRELGVLDAAVVVAGAIIGVGIFANPSNVARILHDPSLILLAWALGGILAMLGGFAYAELGARLPHVGGQYVYLARAYHPAVGFLYGVALLFIINGGGLAAVAIVFASYVDRAIVPLGYSGIPIAASAVLVTLTAINAIGIRAGTRTNNTLMAAKIAGMLGVIGLAFARGPSPASQFEATSLAGAGTSTVPLLFTALVPIMFAYGGWQNCSFIAGEIRDPARNLARANIIGVAAVVTLYLGLNVAYLWVLTPAQVAASPALAADAARAVAGQAGARFVSILIMLSALGFLAVIVMTGPRLYYAMAADGLFIGRAARLHPRWQTPVFALWLQAAVAVTLLTTNTYDQLLSYVVFADWLFFSMTAAALFILRRRDPTPAIVRMPGHPWTTGVFVLAGLGIVVNAFFAYPAQSLIGTCILLVAAGVYFAFVQPSRKAPPAP
jgi:APA family basic amino acid/polyamine antiporter